ncbi:MAG: YegS/Rv2252/BmrU family lipid kinase [Clostridia bacterium]|nr:YegS/Rv2252/BmrU family lipid kinase [Clostridia bacterium]
MKILLIINPKAGIRSITKQIEKIENILKENSNNIEVITKYTKKDYNAEDIIKNYDLSNIDLIVFSGGDGTLNEGINGLMSNNIKSVPVSFIPRGTINDFARTIKMPINKFELSKKIKSENSLEIKRLDIGKINDRHFCYVAGFGNFIDVGYVTSQKLKNIIGKFAYYITVFKELFKIKSYKVTVKTDGISFTDDILFGIISNSVSIAGLKWYRRSDINLQDGTLDMLLIRKPKKLFGYINIIKGFFKKEYTIENNYYLRKIKELEIISELPLDWTIDGEFCGELKDVKIKNLTQSVNFAIPKEK